MADEDKGAKGKKAEVAEDDGLVEVRKGAEVLRVHPTCVKDHEKVGWVR